MIDYKYKDLYSQESVNKQLKIEYDNGQGVITNTDLFSESMTLTESLCSEEQLKFGACEASSIQFKIANVFESLHGKELTVSEVLNGNDDEPFIFGKYKVYSDKPTADRIYREIIAYDALYDVLNMDVSGWYNFLEFPMKLKDFRNSFFEYLGMEHEEVELINDDLIVTETIITTNISGKTILNAICEINGCFGTVKNGKFYYVFLQPITEENKISLTNSLYIKCDYQDYTVKVIDSLQIEGATEEQIVTVGTGSNKYHVNDNFLIYDKDIEDLTTIGNNLLSVISGVSEYRPAEVSSRGNPCIEIGDSISLSTRYQTIETYVLQRTLKGIQALTDEYEVTGNETYSIKLNSESENIKKLWGQTYALLEAVEGSKVVVYTYTNTSEYEIKDTEEKTIISFSLAATSDSIPILLATVPVEMDLDGYITFRYYFDGVEIENTDITKYLERGQHFLTISNYLIMVKNSRGSLKVTAQTGYFESDKRQTDAKIISLETFANGGEYLSTDIDTTPPKAIISKLGIRAVLYGQGLPATQVWDGTLNIVEEIGAFTFGGLSVAPFADSVETVSVQTPISGGNVAQSIGSFAFGGISVASFKDNPVVYTEWALPDIWGALLNDTWNDVKSSTWGDLAGLEEEEGEE